MAAYVSIVYAAGLLHTPPCRVFQYGGILTATVINRCQKENKMYKHIGI